MINADKLAGDSLKKKKKQLISVKAFITSLSLCNAGIDDLLDNSLEYYVQ